MYNPVLQGPLIFIPENFDADAIMANEPDRADKRLNVIDAMHYILHTIIQMDSRQDKRQEIDDTGHYGLSSKILKENCGRHYKYAGCILEKNSVISINPSYQVGKKHKGYCLIGAYARSETKVVELSDGGTTKKKHLQQYYERERANNIELDKIGFITKWYDKYHLKVDEVKAHYFIEFYKSKLQAQIPQNTTRDDAHNIQNRINTRYNTAMSAVKRIINGEFALYRLGKDNRLHSSVTSIMKEFRSFLLYNGESLIGIDVKSSQPYLLTQLLKTATYDPGHPFSIEQLYPELYKSMAELGPNSSMHDTIIMLITYDPPKASHLTRNFLDIEWTGDFYKELIDLESTMDIPDKQRVFKVRSDVKKIIMLSFYSKSWKKKYIDTWKRFSTLFPLEANIIEYFNQLSREDSANYLPILLQRLESKLILDIVCLEIGQQLPDAPIIPIHDAILTTPGYVQRVQEIIKNTIWRVTGIEPGLKLDNTTAAQIEEELLNIVKADFAEIIESLPGEKETFIIKSKKPLLSKMPVRYGEQILSTAFLDDSKDYLQEDE